MEKFDVIVDDTLTDPEIMKGKPVICVLYEKSSAKFPLLFFLAEEDYNSEPEKLFRYLCDSHS